MNVVSQIYVELLYEGTNCWRPVDAEQVGKDVWRIKGEVPEDEIWAFQPGDVVRVETRRFGDSSDLLVAIEAVEEPAVSWLSPIDRVANKLQSYPQVRYELLGDGSGIEIEAPNSGGFSVSLVHNPPEWIVHAGDRGGHWHFDDPDDALSLLAFCLSEECRLRVTQNWLLTRSILEMREGDEWTRVLVCGIFWPSLRRPSSVTFQNRIISGERG